MSSIGIHSDVSVFQMTECSSKLHDRSEKKKRYVHYREAFHGAHAPGVEHERHDLRKRLQRLVNRDTLN